MIETDAGAPPNIIVVLTDQLRYDCIGANGSTVVQTPHLDAFARSGVRFTHAFTPTGLCGPARASIATGRYPHAHGVRTNPSGRDAVASDIADGVPVLVRSLVAAGYEAGYVGKYHVARHESPVRHGFTDETATDYTFSGDAFREWRAAKGYPVDAHPVFPIERWAEVGPHRRKGAPLFGRESVPLEATPPWYLVEQALEMLDRLRAGGAPAFVVLSFLGPHWPHLVPEPWWSMYEAADVEPWPSFADGYEGKPASLAKQLVHFGVEGWTWEDWAPVVASYFASVSFHDELIGRFLELIAERGVGDALMIVTTDHGDMTGAHRQLNKGPFMYDDVYRIPLLVRWPGVAPAGSVCERFVSNMDVMPTVLAAADAPLPGGLHGADLGPLIAGRSAEGWRDSFFAEYHGDEQGLYSQRMLRTDRFKLVVNNYDLDELYDLDDDPHEMHNLAADPERRHLLLSLQAKLLEWMHLTDDPLARYTAPFLA